MKEGKEKRRGEKRRESNVEQMLARLAAGCVACCPAASPLLALFGRSMAFLAHVQCQPLLLSRLLSFQS